MTILIPEEAVFGRGVTNDVNIATPNQTLILDTTYLAHNGLTLLPDGRIQVTGPSGAGEWMVEATVSLEDPTAAFVLAAHRVWVAYNGIEIPSTRRIVPVVGSTVLGGAATTFARLTNLALNDTVALKAQLVGGTALTSRMHTYGATLRMSKRER